MKSTYWQEALNDMTKSEVQELETEVEAFREVESWCKDSFDMTDDQLSEYSQMKMGEFKNSTIPDELQNIRKECAKLALDDPDNRIGPFARKITKPAIQSIDAYRTSRIYQLREKERQLLNKDIA